MFWMTLKHTKRAKAASASAGTSPRELRAKTSQKRASRDISQLDVEMQPVDCKSPRMSSREPPCGSDSGFVPNASLFPPRAATDVPIEFSQSFTCRTKFDCNPCKPVHAAYKTNGDLIVSDVANKKVKVFNSTGQLKVECTLTQSLLGGLREPGAVAALNNGEILVCDRQAGNVKLFTAEGRCLSLLSSPLKRPVSVAVTSQKRIIVADEGSKDVYLFQSLSDRKPKSFTKTNGSSVAFESPQQVCLTTSNVVIVYDATLRKLYLFDDNGKLKSDILGMDIFLQDSMRRMTREYTKSHLGSVGFCAANNDILVCHGPSNRIARYNIEENTVTRDLIDVNNNCINKPFAIATSVSGFVAVLEEGLETVKIFKYMI